MQQSFHFSITGTATFTHICGLFYKAKNLEEKFLFTNRFPSNLQA